MKSVLLDGETVVSLIHSISRICHRLGTSGSSPHIYLTTVIKIKYLLGYTIRGTMLVF